MQCLLRALGEVELRRAPHPGRRRIQTRNPPPGPPHGASLLLTDPAGSALNPLARQMDRKQLCPTSPMSLTGGRQRGRGLETLQLDTQSGGPEHADAGSITCFLSLRGIVSTDERVFDQAFDDTLFRHEAHAILRRTRRLRPRRRVGRGCWDVVGKRACNAPIGAWMSSVNEGLQATAQGSGRVQRCVVWPQGTESV